MEKVLLVSNARAGSVSARTKEVIVKALAADFKLEVADTQARNHASELARDAVDRDFDAVVVFGGDGTLNEAAQPLVGTDVALGVIPGGSTNVMARSLGVPRDPVEATAFVASHLRSDTKRRVNVGRANDRYFIFSAGMGLDAEVVKRVEADPEGKRRRGEMLFVSNALKLGVGRYRRADPMITLEVPGFAPVRVLLTVCCNARPFTYFKRFPVDVCPTASLDGGLSLFALSKLRTGTIPRIVWAIFVSRSHTHWRNTRFHSDLRSFKLTADDPLPMQVDGDYIGERRSAEMRLVERSLDLLV